MIVFYFDTIDDYRNAEKVEAVVVDRLEGYGRRGRYYYPGFRLEYGGSSYSFYKQWGFFPGRYHIGGKVTAIFPKGEPGKAEVYYFLPYRVSLTKFFFRFYDRAVSFCDPHFLQDVR